MTGRTLQRDSVYLTDPKSLKATLFVKGDTIPDDFEVGDHLFEEEPDWEGNPDKGGILTGADLYRRTMGADEDGSSTNMSEAFDPETANVKETLDYVGDDRAKASDVLEAEKRRAKPRAGVVGPLEDLLSQWHPSEYKVDEVLAYVGDDKELAAEVQAQEQASERPRAGVIEGLQKVIDNGGDGS